jgi:hypothetical protein
MRSADDHTDIVREPGALGIVLVEGFAPHRRPQSIAAQAQDQLEHMLIEGMIDPAELLARPGAERRLLVVDEDSAIAHGRTFQPPARQHPQVYRRPHRHIRPPRPWRDADAPRQIVSAEYRAALVRPGDDQRPTDSSCRIIDDLLEIGFPSSGDAGNIEPFLAHEPVDDRALPQGPDDHRDGSVGSGFVEELTCAAGDAADVGA